MSSIVVRRSRIGDVKRIATLVNGFAVNQRMLPRSPDSIALAIDDYIVAVDDRERVLACGAVREYSPSVAEVAAVAVAPGVQGKGLGRTIVRRVEELARVRGISELFALTLEPVFFQSMGYCVVDPTCYPEKIRRDCLSCERRSGCAEICVRRLLDAGVVQASA